MGRASPTRRRPFINSALCSSPSLLAAKRFTPRSKAQKDLGHNNSKELPTSKPPTASSDPFARPFATSLSMVTPRMSGRGNLSYTSATPFFPSASSTSERNGSLPSDVSTSPRFRSCTSTL
ncbi:hypothetical protein BCR35DRAFT_305437 [Leucosporidium creatinivorum]|uniref:Uncharacterized protein n=1 Tax=Leucosporidium creatinivorum TaxID=106004 RepID=A0A1Y2F3Y1_9BASI|nr:hypothetical protein BCR35DRAFT_305437 [Leucosporidium creatinivorum]